jgi:hypothetical protein
MKTKMRIAELASISLILCLFANAAQAQGHGTQGGGRYVTNASGGKELYDLTALQCEIKKGSELIDTMSVLKERIETLKKVYWYFGFSLEREIKDMTFCFTTAEFNPNFLPRSTDGKGILLITNPVGAEFVGLRSFQAKEAYIKNPLFSSSSPLSQAMTIIHETMHSFIPLNVSDRDAKLRGIVGDLSRLSASEASAGTRLEGSIQFNRVNFPARSRVKKSMKYLEFAFGSIEEQRAALLNGSIQMQILIRAPWKKEVSSLLASDQDYLNSVSGNEAREFLARYCEENDEEVLNVLRAQSTEEFDIDLFALSLPSVQDEINSDPSAGTLASVGKKFKTIYQKITTTTATINRERIQVSGGIRALAQSNGSLDNPDFALRLIPIESFAENIPLAADTRVWIGLVTRLAKSQTAANWIQTISQNGALSTALDQSKLILRINSLNAPMADEKREVLNLIPRLYSKFKEAVYQELKNQHLDKHADAWKNLVN